MKCGDGATPGAAAAVGLSPPAAAPVASTVSAPAVAVAAAAEAAAAAAGGGVGPAAAPAGGTELAGRSWRRGRRPRRPAFPAGQDERVNHRSESEETEDLVNQEAQHGNEIEHEHDQSADDHCDGRMTQLPAAADHAPAEPRKHHRLAEQSRAKGAEYDEWDRGDADDGDTEQNDGDRNDQDAQQRRDERHPGLRLHRDGTASHGIAEEQCEEHV